jgi:serine/threonine-protein kinase RsbT
VRLSRARLTNEAELQHAVLEARRLAGELGFPPASSAKIATAVSELGRNILKYARGGTVEFYKQSDGVGAYLEIIVRDRGPGIEDIEVALEDHYSTSGTLGLGLPGVRRLMDGFVLESTPGRGTCVTIRMRLRATS